MASKRDIIIIALVVVIFSVPICADTDPCEGMDKICQNGKCVVEAGSPKCNCTAGFGGIRCEKEIDLCEGTNCKNGAKCVVVATHPKCNCTAGYTGLICDKAKHPCVSMNKLVKRKQYCQNGGTCHENKDGTAECICTADFTGTSCEKDETNPKPKDEKKPKPKDECPKEVHFCQNGATCHLTSAGYLKCVCVEGYTGLDCANETSPCDVNPCHNKGTCQKKTVVEYTCQCFPRYTGKNCDIDKQSGDYLMNRLQAAIWCAHDGLKFEIDETKLAEGLIQAGTKSIHDLKYVDKQVLNKYMHANISDINFGKFLDRLKTTEDFDNKHDMCISNPCQNGGKCEDLICRYHCNCNADYKGTNCETKREGPPASTPAPKTDTPTPAPTTDTTTSAPKNDTGASTSKRDAAPTNKNLQLILYALCIIAIAALGFLGYSYRQKVRSWVCDDKDTKKGSKNIDYKRLKEEGTNKKMDIEIDSSEGSTYIY